MNPQRTPKLDLKLILSALVALPQVLKYLQKLGEQVQKMSIEADLKRLEEATSDYEKARTLQERMAAARKFFTATRKL